MLKGKGVFSDVKAYLICERAVRPALNRLSVNGEGLFGVGGTGKGEFQVG